MPAPGAGWRGACGGGLCWGRRGGWPGAALGGGSCAGAASSSMWSVMAACCLSGLGACRALLLGVQLALLPGKVALVRRVLP